jgi:imidazolonepropionase-like amidohydrolase
VSEYLNVKRTKFLEDANSYGISVFSDDEDSLVNAEVINLRDYTVLPGLIDAHTHVIFTQEPSEDFAECSMHTLTMESDALRVLRGAKRAKSYLDVGITTIKDLGNSGLFLDVALRDAINEGTIVGPRIFASGPIMSSSGGQIYGVSHKHQNLVSLEYRVIEDVADAKNAVRQHLNQNVDLIKICSDNIPNNTRMTIEEMKAIVEIAHSYGLKVTAHSITNQSVWEAVQAGVDGIEHGFTLADSTLNLMAEKNIFLVPTENSLSYMKTYTQLASNSEELPSWVDGYLVRMKERLTRAIDKGVTIVAGSDNYTDIKVPRGTSSQDMFQAYFEAGMKPLDILQSATYLSALAMNQEKRIGILRPNAKADIIAIKGDIMNDFVNTIKNVAFVMKDGEVYLQHLN